eukprot:7103949-Alexandrium_andersonii.AAC.1
MPRVTCSPRLHAPATLRPRSAPQPAGQCTGGQSDARREVGVEHLHSCFGLRCARALTLHCCELLLESV